MKARSFVPSLLIAVLSGCEVSEPASPFTAPPDETSGPPELIYVPPVVRTIPAGAPPTGAPIKIIFSTAFVAIELAAGATGVTSGPRCPASTDVGDLMRCLASPGCGDRPDPAELKTLNDRAQSRHDEIWAPSGNIGDQPAYVANDGYGTLIVADGRINLTVLTYAVTSDPSGPVPDATGWPCGQAPCDPAQCPGGSNPGPRILDAINRAVLDHPAQCTCPDVCLSPPPLGSCPCAEICGCPC